MGCEVGGFAGCREVFASWGSISTSALSRLWPKTKGKNKLGGSLGSRDVFAGGVVDPLHQRNLGRSRNFNVKKLQKQEWRPTKALGVNEH